MEIVCQAKLPENSDKLTELFLVQEENYFIVITRESVKNKHGSPNSRVGSEERSYFDDKGSAEKFFSEMYKSNTLDSPA